MRVSRAQDGKRANWRVRAVLFSQYALLAALLAAAAALKLFLA